MSQRTLPWLAGALLALALAVSPAVAKDVPLSAAPDFTLTDSSGTKHSLSDFRGKWVVLEWTNYDCPFVKKHYNSSVKNMQTLQKAYTAKGVVWLSICSSAKGKQGYMTPAEATKRKAAEGASPTALLLDPSGDVGRLFGAKVTPDMRVIDPKGRIVYTGAIDSVRSKDPADIKGATNHVAQMLDKALSGATLTPMATRPYG
jgi:peroxiredoxin